MDSKALLNKAIALIGLNELASRIENASGEAMSRQNLRKYANGERTVQPWLVAGVQIALRNHKQDVDFLLKNLTASMVENYRAQISEPIVPVLANQNGGITYANLLHPETLSDRGWCERKERWQSLLHGNFSNQCEHLAIAPSVNFAQALIACGHPAEELVEIYRSEKSGEHWHARTDLLNKIHATIEANDLPRDSSTHEDEEELF